MTQEERERAMRLRNYLFGSRHDLGFVAVGSGRFHVNVYGEWDATQLTDWEGVPVEWSTNAGPIVAYAGN